MVINFYTITSFINFLTSAVLAVLVILKNRKGQKNIAFFIFTGLISLWSLSYFFWQNVTDSPDQAIFWCRTLGIFLILIPPAYLHFTLAITETFEEKKNLLIIVYLFFYLFILTDVTPVFINKVEPIMNVKYWPIATPVFSVYVICFMICILYSSYLLIKKYKTSTGLIKMQIKYVSIGMIGAFIFGSTNFLPWYKIPIYPIGNALVPIYFAFIAYTITVYKLMNVKILIRNLLFYFLVAIFMYIIFYIVAITYKIIFGDVFAPGTYFLGLFLAPIFAIILYTSSNFLSTFINKYIFNSIYTYQQAIKKASYRLSHYTSISEITNIISDTIKETLQPEGVAILLLDNTDFKNTDFKIAKNYNLDPSDIYSIDFKLFSEYFNNKQKILTRENIEQLIQDSINQQSIQEKELLCKIENQLHQNNIYACAPLKGNSNLLGMIIMSKKQYESPYLQEDFELLETLSQYAQIATENAFLYKKIEKENLYLEEAIRSKQI